MKKTISLVLGIILLATLASAYSSMSFYSPGDLFDNEWVLFTVIFLIFFAIIFFALQKTFKDQKGVSMIVSLGVSLLISSIFAKSSYYYGFLGEELFSYVAIAGFIFVYALLIKLFYQQFKGLGISVILIASWLVIHFNEGLYYFINDLIYIDAIIQFYEFLGSWIALIIILGIIVLLIAFNKKNKTKLDKLLD